MTGSTSELVDCAGYGSCNILVCISCGSLAPTQPIANSTMSFKPGLEGRVRAGADRLIGRAARLLVGLTVSTFSTDVYSGASGLLGGWDYPGTRYIGGLGVVGGGGRSTVSFSAWDYYPPTGLTNAGPNP